ncbi:MAG: hypothetical protein E6J34_03675 [Chloroflexi bacterium]|jgi:hypothetical protein|nr:MAG: hypothetical protein E6J34_03675 [Chloroflexota bacterium]
MITQTIKRWWNRLFGWWPWKRSSQTSYTQTVTNRNQSAPQDTVWRTTVDGPVSLTGVTSVAIDQQRDENFAETAWLTTEERSEHLVQELPPMEAEERLDATCLSLIDTSQEVPVVSSGELSVPTYEQQLAFLHYLVQRGIVNEGFTEGQVPAQYQQKVE